MCSWGSRSLLLPAISTMPVITWCSVSRGSSTENGAFDVTRWQPTGDLSFLAKPSRLPVNLHDGISGVVYVFDTFQNLVTAAYAGFIPTFRRCRRSANADRDHAQRRGLDQAGFRIQGRRGQFVARVEAYPHTRMIQQVPGDPCKLKMNARPAGQRLQLETDPVRDCSGNAVPDGTIVPYNLRRRGSHGGCATQTRRCQDRNAGLQRRNISVATGVVMGNEIRWGRKLTQEASPG